MFKNWTTFKGTLTLAAHIPPKLWIVWPARVRKHGRLPKYNMDGRGVLQRGTSTITYTKHKTWSLHMEHGNRRLGGSTFEVVNICEAGPF